MDLARIAVKLRPRNPWEGIDLGCMLAREWFLPLWLLWMVSALPVMLLATLLPLPLWLAGGLLWWLKPLYEPLLLYWLGRRLFGERPSWRELRQNWWPTVWPQLFANLTWRRLNPARSFVMPVAVLERLRGKARSERIRVLSRRSNAASWLTIIGIHFEFIFELGLFFLIALLIPEELLWTTWNDYLFAPDPVSAWLQQISTLLAMSLVAPFYVAGGFALYLTRRSELEAWDIELGLRRLMQRQSGSTTASGLAAMLLVGLLAWGGPSAPLQAAEVDRQQVRATIEEVLADEAFGRTEEVTRWKYVGEDDADDTADGDEPVAEWLEQWAEGLAMFSELLLWLVGAGLLAYLIHWFVSNREFNPVRFRGTGNGRVVPTEIAGLDLRPESLPDDPAAVAERLIGEGNYRAALSLLYRGALSAMVHRHALEIPDGATEGECRLLVGEQLGQPLDECFSSLTGVWLRLAYGHHPPERDRALALCRDWRGCFGDTDVHA